MDDEEALSWLQGKRGYPYADECVAHLAARFERLRAIEARAVRMRDDDTPSPGWSVRQANARVILGEV